MKHSLAIILLLTSVFVCAQDAPKIPPPCTITQYPKPVYAPDPLPPGSWRHQNRKATVNVRINLTANGKVSEVEVVSSTDESANKTVVKTVKGWRFQPALCGTEPVDATMHISVTVSLQQG